MNLINKNSESSLLASPAVAGQTCLPAGRDKKFQFALKIGWRALAEGEPTKTFPNWRCLLVKIRTFFDENPDCEF